DRVYGTCGKVRALEFDELGEAVTAQEIDLAAICSPPHVTLRGWGDDRGDEGCGTQHHYAAPRDVDDDRRGEWYVFVSSRRVSVRMQLGSYISAFGHRLHEERL